jgi:hypothetical protein
LYIAYRDNALSGKCTVMTYVDDAWEALGVAGISTGATSYTSLQIDYAGRVIVAFKDWANGSRTSVKRFENEEWTDVGSSGFSTASANYQDLAINALGHMFVAYEIGDVEVQRFVVDGCTSTDACNFDPDATDDDESCVILEVFEISGELLPQAGTVHTYTYPSTAGSTYVWEVVNGTIISGQGTATVEIEWGSIGDAQLSVVETNAELCESPLVELAITVPVSLEDIDSEELLIYPNPANDIVFISLPTGIGQLSFRIFDARGLEVWDGSVNQQSSEIAVGHLAPGAYHLVAHSSDSTWVNSLILKR